MSQHDYVIADQVGADFLPDLNSSLQAIVSNNSGTTAPTVTYANMIWTDTSTNPPTIKRRDSLNTTWIDENNITGNLSISANNSIPALTITQTGTGDCLSVYDETGDTSRFVVTAAGNVGIGGTGADHKLTVASGNATFAQTAGTKIAFSASDAFTSAGAVNTARYGITYNPQNDFDVGLSGWGSLYFYTGDAQRMHISNAGKIGLGSTAESASQLLVAGTLSSAPDTRCVRYYPTIPATATSSVVLNQGIGTTVAASFTLPSLTYYSTFQSTIGAGSAITNQYGFLADSSMVGATNNYGFYGAIPAGTGRYNFYAAGTAPNYFAGDVRSNTTFTENTTVTNSDSSVTLTAANLLGHIVSGTPTAGINYTLPTGTDLNTAFSTLANNQAFNWSVINLAAATHAITLLGNTASTIVGNAVVQANTSGTFRTRKTATNTFVTYRIS